MIQDFVLFLRHCREIVHYVRGVLLVMLLVLSLCIMIFVFAENQTLGNSSYLILITALTIGYGDIVPKTTLGAITAIFAGIIGVIFIGLCVAIATRALSQSHEEKKNKESDTSKF